MNKIGITTTIPSELIFLSGNTPVDLNNIFITSKNPNEYVEFAEKDGFPRNMCAWIKGLYTAIKRNNIKKIIGVCEGDCSNTISLLEILKDMKIDVIPFAYPHDKDLKEIELELNKLAHYLGVNLNDVKKYKNKCDKLRNYALEIDRLTWQENLITGFENHYWLINTTLNPAIFWFL